MNVDQFSFLFSFKFLTDMRPFCGVTDPLLRDFSDIFPEFQSQGISLRLPVSILYVMDFSDSPLSVIFVNRMASGAINPFVFLDESTGKHHLTDFGWNVVSVYVIVPKVIATVRPMPRPIIPIPKVTVSNIDNLVPKGHSRI